MKNVLIVFLCTIPFILNGQDTNVRINNIRQMYQNALSEKSTYLTKVKDITWDAFSGEDDSYSKGTATSYFALDNSLKIIVLTLSSTGQYNAFSENVELYFEKDSLYFIYSLRNNTQWEEVFEQKGKTISITEERVYFNDIGKCIRYLIKEAEGKPETINTLLENTANIEIDCRDAEELILNAKKYTNGQ